MSTTLRAREQAVVRVPYGWGIVDKAGHPYWSESCVCKDRGPMENEVGSLNDGDTPEYMRIPFRVVRLYFTRLAGESRRKGT